MLSTRLAAALLGLAAVAGHAATPPPLGTASDEEVPFITTPDAVTVAMLQLAKVGPADVLIDLGSGDGRIVITAAARFGARGLGVDIVPDLVERSRANAQRAGVADRALFRTQDLFETDLSAASVITLYLLPHVNLQLRPRLLALAPGTRIVSHDWDMDDWQPDRTLVLDVPDKAIGRDKLSRLHLWVVPARLHGLWCGALGVSLRIDQQFQRATAMLSVAGEQRLLQGRIDANTLRLLGAGVGVGVAGQAWQATAEADGALRVQQAPPGGALLAGQVLQATAGRTCQDG